MPQSKPPASVHASGTQPGPTDRAAWSQRLDVRLARNVLLPVTLFLLGTMGWQGETRHRAAVAQAQAGLDGTIRATGELLTQSASHYQSLLETLLAQESTTELLQSWQAGDLDQATRTSHQIERSFQRVLQEQPGLLAIELYSDMGKLFLSVAGGGEPLSPLDVAAESWFQTAQDAESSFRWESSGAVRITRKYGIPDEGADLLGSIVIDFDQLTSPAAEWARGAGSDTCLILSAAARQVPMVGAPHGESATCLSAMASAAFLEGSLHLEQPLHAALAMYTPEYEASSWGQLTLVIILLAALWIGLQQTVLGPISTLTGAASAFHKGTELPAHLPQPKGSSILRPVLAGGSVLLARLARSTKSLAAANSNRAVPQDELSRVERALRTAVEASRVDSATLGELQSSHARQITDQENQWSRRELDARSSSRARGEFLADLSGGLEASLAAAMGAVKQLLSSSAAPPHADLAKTVHGEIAGALRLLEQTKELSGLETGRLLLCVADCDLYTTLEELADRLAQAMVPGGLELVLEIHPGAPRRLLLDQGRLGEVVTTLVETMGQIADQGEIVVRVLPAEGMGPGTTLRFEVYSATGPVNEPALQRAFEPFVGGSASDTPKVPGNHPLGNMHLAISAQLVRCMHGSIGVTSSVADGTTFWFTGRFERVVDHQIPSVENAPECLDGRRVLIVDDSESSRRALSTQLSPANVQPILAAGAREAVAALEHAAGCHEPFDAALIDLRMPEQDGLALARWIKQNGPTLDLPLILMAADGQDQDLPERDATLFAGRLRKPVHAAALLSGLADAVPERRPIPAPVLLESTPELESARVVDHPEPQPHFEASAWAPEEPTRILFAQVSGSNDPTTAHALERLGYDLVVVQDIQLVLAAVEAEPFHALVVDCTRSESAVYGIADKVRNRHDLRACLPIIGLTAEDTPEQRDRCIEAGMDDCIVHAAPITGLGTILKRWVSVSSHLNAQEIQYIADTSRNASLKRA